MPECTWTIALVGTADARHLEQLRQVMSDVLHDLVADANHGIHDNPPPHARRLRFVLDDHTKAVSRAARRAGRADS